MSKNLMLDVGQANELKLAFRRAGFSNDDIKRLCEGNTLVDVRRALRGEPSLPPVIGHVIDCDAGPSTHHPDFVVHDHQKGGAFTWDPTQVWLWASEASNGQLGHGMRLQLAGQPVLNANVIDYLFLNRHLIPDEWKEDEQGGQLRIYFWGTLFRAVDTSLFVRCLYWDRDMWIFSYSCLSEEWDCHRLAALRWNSFDLAV